MMNVLAIAAFSANLQLAAAWAGESCCKGWHWSTDYDGCKRDGTTAGDRSTDSDVTSKGNMATYGKAWATVMNGPDAWRINEDKCCLLFCCHSSPGFDNHITVSCPGVAWKHFNCDDGAYQPFRNVDVRRLPEPPAHHDVQLAELVAPEADRRRFNINAFFAQVVEAVGSAVNAHKCQLNGHKDVWKNPPAEKKSPDFSRFNVKVGDPNMPGPWNGKGDGELQKAIDEHTVVGQAKKIVHDVVRDGAIISGSSGATGAAEEAANVLKSIFGRRRVPEADRDNLVE